MEKKKILFLSPLPPPHYGSAMSSEMCLDILTESDDFEVTNIKLNYSKKMNDVGRINLNKLMGFFRVKKEIKKNLKYFNPNIIYMVPATSGLGLIRDTCFVKQIKAHSNTSVIFHLRSRITKSDWNNPILRQAYRCMLLKQKAIVMDEDLIIDLHGLIYSNSIYILPNAIKNEISEIEFRKIMIERCQRNSYNILFLSNMAESKGWPKVLNACKILKEKNINFKCNFVGAWQDKKSMANFKKIVLNHGLFKNVTYFGKKMGQEKRKILACSDILVFPTEYKLETFPRVVIEAMMFGLPVIANGTGAIPKTIQHGVTGYILKENSPEEIAEYLEVLSKDKILRCDMGEKGRNRFIRKYELAPFRKEFIGIFRKIVATI